MKTSKPKKMCRFQGLPPYYLPKWRYMPLQNKLPMLKETPDGAVNLFFGDGNIGTGPWLKNKNLDFNTWDPLLLKLPCNPEYNALRDPNLKCYFNNSRRLKLLYKQGLITRDGKSCVTLKDFNRYRSYLHDCSLDAIRTMQNQTECEDVHGLVVRTVIRSKEDKLIKHQDPCDQTALGIRYSEILRDEMKGVCERSVTEFETTPYFREFCEGERESLLKLRQVLLNYTKKKALIRLRKLQNYEDTQAKFWNEWMKRSKSQVQERADYIAKEKVLNYEKCKHIKEFNEYISHKRRQVFDVVQMYREKHITKLSNLINTVRKRVCVKSHRQYPLSAQCPYNVFEGGEFGDVCPYNELVMRLEAELYCDYRDDEPEEHLPYPKDKIKLEGTKVSKEFGKPGTLKSSSATHFNNISSQDLGERRCSQEILETEISRAVAAQEEVPSVADSLTFTIIQNAMALTVKHLRLPMACVTPANQSKFKIIRIQYFMKEMSNEIKDELADLLKNDFEILHSLSQAKISAAEKEAQQKHQMEAEHETKEPKSRWEDAPLLRSNSPSLTGRYIREQLIKVSARMKCEGTIMDDKNQVPQAVVDQRFQAAISEASRADDLDILSCQLIDGKKAICEAREILDAIDMKNTEDKDSLVLCLIAALLRTALITIKDSLSCGAIESDDVLTISSYIHKEQDLKRQAAVCKDVQDLIERYSDDLMKNKCMDYLIRDTIRKIKCSKDAPQSDVEISKLLSKAAKKFVTKVIENVMSDDIFKRKKEKKAKYGKRIETVECVEEESEGECDGSDSLADYNQEDRPAKFDQVYGDDIETEYNIEDLPTTIDDIYPDESMANYNLEDHPSHLGDMLNDDILSKYNEEDRPTTIDQIYPEDNLAEYNEADEPAKFDDISAGSLKDKMLSYGGEDQPADFDLTYLSTRDGAQEYYEEDTPADFDLTYLSIRDGEQEYSVEDLPDNYDEIYASDKVLHGVEIDSQKKKSKSSGKGSKKVKISGQTEEIKERSIRQSEVKLGGEEQTTKYEDPSSAHITSSIEQIKQRDTSMKAEIVEKVAVDAAAETGEVVE